jgi:peptidoglycan pentaglycine glycine transferase (the first glycine)
MQFGRDNTSSPAMDAPTWNSFLASLPDPHILQTWEWAQVKARFGWQPFPTVWHDRNGQLAGAAMVLGRSIPIGGFAPRLRVMYIPKGPLLRDWGDAGLRGQVLDDLRSLARRQGAIFIKMDPDVRLGVGIPGSPEAAEDPLGEEVTANLRARGWRLSNEQVQFRNTALIDLTLPEEALLAQMKQKTRYNIRLAAKKGVTIRVGTPADLHLLYRMYAETCVRDGFVIRSEDYYRTVWETFMSQIPASEARSSQTATLPSIHSSIPSAEALIAEVEGKPVAAVVVFRFAGKAWYLYGMSREAHRDKMPNHLLQWEAIRRAKQAGCTTYDLWGAPDEFIEDDPMWGVFRFKQGLGCEVVRLIGAWDLPVRPLYYRLYTQMLPRLLDKMRLRGKEATKKIVYA